jgi:hypothetical protein
MICKKVEVGLRPLWPNWRVAMPTMVVTLTPGALFFVTVIMIWRLQARTYNVVFVFGERSGYVLCKTKDCPFTYYIYTVLSRLGICSSPELQLHDTSIALEAICVLNLTLFDTSFIKCREQTTECKIWGFHCDDYEECRLLKCGAV